MFILKGCAFGAAFFMWYVMVLFTNFLNKRIYSGKIVSKKIVNHKYILYIYLI